MNAESDGRDDLRDWARAEGRAVFEELVKLAKDEAVSATKLAAIREVLDRAYGKTTQAEPQETENGGERTFRWAKDKSEATPDPSLN